MERRKLCICEFNLVLLLHHLEYCYCQWHSSYTVLFLILSTSGWLDYTHHPRNFDRHCRAKSVACFDSFIQLLNFYQDLIGSTFMIRRLPLFRFPEINTYTEKAGKLERKHRIGAKVQYFNP